MIVVVADTSPLNYLVQIRCEHILPQLYERLFVPPAVVEELGHPGTVSAVREWLAKVPSWLVVRGVVSEADPATARLDLSRCGRHPTGLCVPARLLRAASAHPMNGHVQMGLTSLSS